MMTTTDLQNIKKVLEGMADYEMALADFYNCCAEAYKTDAAFWKNLQQAEIFHGGNIKQMLDILDKKPDKFEMGRPFNLVALNTAKAWLKENTERVRKGEIPREKMLVMARDIEQSVLESRYAEIVKTFDIEFQNLLKRIMSQTYEHKTVIQKKIDDTKA